MAPAPSDAADRGAPGRRRGRRPGGSDTREQLLDAARAAFTEMGYDGATVRMIAERAGVDAAMVNHWFGGKEQLFTAALNVPLDPVTILDRVLPGDRDHIGERIITTFLTLWDATGGGPLAALIQSVASHEEAARMMRDFVTTVLVGRVVSVVAPDRPALRANLCASQLFGIGLTRYVLKLEPIASADHLTLVKAVAPTLQRYLVGDID